MAYFSGNVGFEYVNFVFQETKQKQKQNIAASTL